MTSARFTRRASVVAALILLNGAAWALPQDGKPVFGKATISQPNGSTLRIDQTTARAGIDWSSFSIAAGETVRVVQPGASAVLVNRVTGLDPSLILGKLQADGRVFLTNPRGVIFGAGAQVDVGGLVATTLKLGDADAQAGRWWLQAVEGAGSVVNEGSLRAPGGTIALVGPQVLNRGSLDAARVALGAVGEVQVDLDGDGLILLNARAADAARLDQLGNVSALGGRAEMIAAARGQVAGTVLNLRGAVQSRGFSGQGGEIVIDGGASGIVEVGASVDASSASGRGGDVLLLGQKLLLDNDAQILAGGRDGGGRVRIGGDFHGDNPALRNSEMLVVRPGARIDASAGALGDGGRVVLWSEQSTRYFGAITAHGGAAGGDGGNVEVSSRHALEFRGSASLTAPRGRLGQLLLDPTDIVIDDALVDTVLTGDIGFTDTPSNPIFAAVDVSALLTSSSLTLQASHDIDVHSAISGSNRLTLQAGNNITIGAPISTNGLTLSANDNSGGTGSGSGRVTTTASLNAGGFDLVISNNSGSGVHSLGGNLSGDSLTLSGNAALTAGQTWTFASNSLPYAGSLSGSAALTLAGSGFLDFVGDNSGFSGDITVASGTLRLSGANGAGGAGTINVQNGAQVDVEGITLANPQINLATGATLGNVGSDPAAIGGTVTLLGDATLDASIGALTLLGPLTESGSARSLTTQGTVTLFGISSYTGATTIGSGTLTLQGSSASTAFLTGSGTLTVASAGLLTGTPALILNGSGVVSLSGNQTIASLDDQTQTGGTLLLNSGTLSITGTSSSSSFGGVVQGAGGLTLLADTLTLSGNNSFTGTTTVSGGTLVLAGGHAVANSAIVAMAPGAALQITADQTLGGLQGSGGSVDIGAHQLTVGGSGNSSFDGSIAGTGGTLLKTGSGTFTLNGSHSFSGGATVAAGTLALGAAERLADGLPVTVQTGATLALAGSETVASLALAGTLSGGGTLSAANYTLSGGTIDAAVGAGTLISTGSSQINGSAAADITVSSGTLTLGGAERIADSASLTVNSGATLVLAGNERVGTSSLLGSVGGTGTLSAAISLLSGASYSAPIVADAVQSSGTNIVSGTLTASQIDVSSGSLILASAGRLQGAPALTLGGGTSLSLAGNETIGSLAGNGSVTLGSATLTTGSRGNSSFSGTLSGSGGVVKTGSSTFTLSGGNSHGSTSVQGGALVAAGGSALPDDATVTMAAGGTLQLTADETVGALQGGGGSVDLGAHQLTVGGANINTSFDGSLSGSGGTLLKTGTATLTLNGSSSFTGGATVAAGTLALGAADRLAASLPVTVQSGATLQLSGNQTLASLALAGTLAGTGTLTAASYSLTGGAVNADLGAGGLTSTGSSQLSGSAAATVTVSGGTLTLGSAERIADTASLTVNSGATLVLAGNERVGTSNLQGSVGGSGTLSAATSLLSGASYSAAIVADDIQSSGSNSVSGTLTAAQIDVTSGSLTLATAGRVQGAPLLTLSSGTTLTLGGNETLGALTGSGNVALGSATLTTGTGGDSTFNGALSGSGSLVKTGSSSFTLTGSNSHGSTSVLGGVLVVGNGGTAGSLGSGPVANSAVLRLNRSDAVSFNNLVSGSGQLQFNGAGTTTVTAANIYSGGTDIANGTVVPLGAALLGTGAVTLSSPSAVLQLSDGALLGNNLRLAGGTVSNLSGSGTVSGPVTLLADSTLAASGSGLLFSNVIDDGGAGFGLSTQGPITFSQDNPYSGRTTVASGQLTLGTGGNTGTVGGPITITGTLRLNRSNAVVATNDIDGTGTLLLDTPAGITMTGANHFTGSTLLHAGALQFSGAGAQSGSGTLTLDGTTLDIANGAVIDAAVISIGGTISNSAGSGTLAGNLTLQSTSTLRSDGTGLRVTGSIGDGGSGIGFTSTSTGAGQVELAAANTFGGAVSVTAGTLVASQAAALGSVAQGTTISSGAALQVNGVSLAAEPLFVAGSGTAGSGVLLGVGSVGGPITLTGDAAIGGNLGINGAIGDQGAGRSLTKVGGSLVTLGAVNSYSGSTTVSAGTLALGVADAIVSSTVVVDGGTLDLGTHDNHLPGLSLRSGSVDGSGGAVFSASTVDLRAGTVGAVLAGSAGIAKSTSGTVTLSGSNLYAGSTAVQAGTLTLASGERLPDGTAVQVSPGASLALGGNETVGSLALQGTLGGSGRLSATSYAFDGGTANSDLGGGSLNSTGVSTLNGQVAVNSIGVDSGRLVLGSAGRLTATPSLNLPAGSVLALGGNEAVGSLTGSGTVELGSAQLTAGSAADFSFGGQFSGAGGFAKAGSGTMTLVAAQAYGGATQVLGGTLFLPSTERLPDSTALTLASGATLQLAADETVASATLGGHLVGPGRLNAALYALAGGTIDTDLGAGALTSSGDSRLNGTSAAATVDVQGGTLTLGAAQRLASTAAVSVQQPGTLSLSGDQTVQTLDLSGVLTGSGTFTAPGGYALNAGSRVDIPLGVGTLNVDGNSTLNQTAGATTVNVNAGTLTITQTGDLSNQATVSVADNATLAVSANQTVGALTLAGNVSGTGTLAVSSVVASGAEATVLTTLQVDGAVTVGSGKLTIGDGATSGSLVAASTTVNSGATLAFNRSDQVAVGSIGGSGTLRQDGSGTVQLTGTAASIGAVEVAAGNLALAGGGGQINSAATVAVSSGGTLTLAGSGESVASLTLQGRLAGSSGSTLTAGSYTLNGGVADANLGAGTLNNVGGNSVIGGNAAVTAVNVSGGTLAVSGSQSLLARPGLDVQSGATLRLTGAQTVGAVTNAGTLVTGSALDASSFSGNGAVQIGGRISTTGDQTYGGALSAVVGNPTLVAGGDIVALAPGNDFNGATLALQARSVRLFGGGNELRLGALNLGGGDSQITAAGRLVLAGATSLASGSLTLDAQGVPGDGAALTAAGGATALLPDPINGAASGTRLMVAEATVSQTAQGDISTGSGATLRVRASGGGSIELENAGNTWAGSVSAVSGAATGFSFPTGQNQLRLSRVALRADALQLVADGGAAVPGSDPIGPQALAGSSDAIRADIVSLKAATIVTAPGAVIRARLPYSVNQGPLTSAQALVIDTAPARSGAGVFGTEGNPLAIVVGDATLGIGGLFLTVWPEPQNGGAASQRLYMACAGCSNAPVYQFGGDPLAALTYFNGTLLGSAPLSGSTINTNTTLLENARRGLFESAVRTENVAPRLRAGVIAEVGVGRPATEGQGGIRMPEQCEGKAGSMECGAP